MFRGWVYRRKTTNNTGSHAVCSSEAVVNCKALQGVGVATIVTMVAVVLLFIITLVPCSVKPGGERPRRA